MKCIQCQTDNTLRDRNTNRGRCKNCDRPFVFEPTTMGKSKITDAYFQKSLKQLSAEDTLFFTSKQFYYFLNQKLRPKHQRSLPQILKELFYSKTAKVLLPFSSLIILLWLFYLFQNGNSSWLETAIDDRLGFKIQSPSTSLTLLLAFASLIVFWLIFLLRFILAPTGIKTIPAPTLLSMAVAFPIALPQAEKWLYQWQKINQPLPKLLAPVNRRKVKHSFAPEVTTYSFDRAIICDNAPIAQMLIANNFHFEHNCAILSIDGYPQNIIETVREMLRRNDNLKVYALHDFSPQGISLIPSLRSSPTWFKNRSVAIIDLGINARQILTAPLKFDIRCTEQSAAAARQISPDIRATLSDEEFAWLAEGIFVELESFTPKALMRILQRCIGREQQLRATDSSFVCFDDSSDTCVHTTENFG